MDEVKIKCDALLDKYSLTEISKLTCIDISKVRTILKSHLNEKTPKEYSWKLSDELIDEVKDFSEVPKYHTTYLTCDFVESGTCGCLLKRHMTFIRQVDHLELLPIALLEN